MNKSSGPRIPKAPNFSLSLFTVPNRIFRFQARRDFTNTIDNCLGYSRVYSYLNFSRIFNGQLHSEFILNTSDYNTTFSNDVPNLSLMVIVVILGADKSERCGKNFRHLSQDVLFHRCLIHCLGHNFLWDEPLVSIWKAVSVVVPVTLKSISPKWSSSPKISERTT